MPEIAPHEPATIDRPTTASLPSRVRAGWAKCGAPPTPKLGREVAIKILAEAFARDPDRMARLQREAQVLAALNHSNLRPDLPDPFASDPDRRTSELVLLSARF